MCTVIAYFRRFLPVAVVTLFVAILAGACVSDGADGGEELLPDSEAYKVELRLTLPETGQTGTTRATPEGDYDDGRKTPYEDYINVAGGDYCLLLFESAKPYRLLAKVSNVQMVGEMLDLSASKTYVLTGDVPKSLVEGKSNFKLVILANWDGCGAKYPDDAIVGTTTIDNIVEGVGSMFKFEGTFRPTAVKAIPMYGVEDCVNITFRNNIAAYLGTVHLLRAMAKVEIFAAENHLSMTNATLTRCNSLGYAAPHEVYSREDYVKDNYKDDYTDRPWIPDAKMGNSVLENIDFQKLDEGHYLLYIPEYDNLSPGAVPSRIKLTYGGIWEGQDIYIDFKYYDETTANAAGVDIGRAFNVMRNYYYKYTVYKNSVELDVIPYAEVKQEPTFGLEMDDNGNKVDKDGYIVVTDKNGRLLLRITPDFKTALYPDRVTPGNWHEHNISGNGEYTIPVAQDGSNIVLRRTSEKILVWDPDGKLLSIITLPPMI